MGSFDGAGLCELLGLFILHNISTKYGIETSGLYRDDGLSYFHKISGPQSDRTRKDLIKMFKGKFNLKITIQTNLKVVNFLDVTFSMTDETYRSYLKPNSQPVYVNHLSNHPWNIIRQIPNIISQRINHILSSQ